MVGVMAGTIGAHAVAAIDRRITNRNLIVFGGYPRVSAQMDCVIQQYTLILLEQ
jgi:hypothetical protein